MMTARIIRINLCEQEHTINYTPEGIESLLDADWQSTCYGEEFTGRPSTKLVVLKKDFIKLRTEFDVPEYDACRFIRQAKEQEVRLGVYHPDKTWFVAITEGGAGEKTIIGNIMPRLQPLHQIEVIANTYSYEQIVKFIVETISKYFQVLETEDKCLDLSLSNFGIDEQDRLFYLDDEVYRQGDFGQLIEFLANLLRSQQWLSGNLIVKLGQELRKLMLDVTDDTHWLIAISQELKSVFISNERIVDRDLLLNALTSGQRFHYSQKIESSKIVLMADIHANAPALEACLDYIKTKEAVPILVLGDIVGYGPHPRECLEILQSLPQASIIRGNHDHAVANANLQKGVNSAAGWVLQWTISQLSKAECNWLGALPPYLENDTWLAVHGAPIDRTFFNAYVYQMTYTENLEALKNKGFRFCFHGHTHIQKIYTRCKGIDAALKSAEELALSQYALICPGSIGQPRGGQNSAEFAIIDIETSEIEFVQQPYALNNTITDMKRLNFPPALMERLQRGE